MTVQNDIDKVFKNGLADYSEQPPTYIWNNVEQAINDNNNKKNKQLFWAIAASIALLLSFGTGFFVTHLKTAAVITNNQPEANKTDKNTNKTLAPTNSDNTVKANNLPVKENTNKNYSQVLPENTSIKKTEQFAEQQLPTQESDKNLKSSNQNSSKIIQTSAEGTLLPPVFGTIENYTSGNNNNNNNINELAIKSDHLEKIKPQKEYLAYTESEKDIVYLIRLLPLIDETDLDKKSNEKEEYAWSVGVSGTPLYSYRTLNNTSSDDYATAVETSVTNSDYSNEKPLISYAAGIDINYKLHKRWSIQSGIFYSEQGQISEDLTYNELANNYDNFTSDNQLIINTSNGDIIADISFALTSEYFNFPIANSDDSGEEVTSISSSESASFILTYEYYEIPLIVQYKLIDRKLSLSLSGGFSTNFLAGNTTYLKDGSKKEDIDATVEGIKPINYTSVFGVGIEYPLMTQLFVNLNPSFRYSINSLNEAGNVHPYSFGIFTGLKYKF